MGWLIAALGTGLAVAGTLGIYSGAPYIQVEWGYSEVIAGTTALSAGILAVALAAILFALRDLKRLATAGVEAPSESAAERASSAPAARLGRTIPEPVVPVPPVPVPAVAVQAPRASPPEDLAGPVRGGEGVPSPPIHDGVPLGDQAPTVVGRYEANGASYVLFSDGTIEVETETGTHRYASMADLRADIERESTG